MGAGPAGSYAAYELASLGHRVAVFEEKEAPGLNVCCTGIISTECFRSLDLSQDVVLAEISSAKFFSPSQRCLRLQVEDVQAYVVNRHLFDKAIASKAQSQGARYFFSSPVIDVRPGKDSVRAEALCDGVRETFGARAVVVASGFRRQLPRRLGLGKIGSFLVGAQTEIEAEDVAEVEVYFSQKIAPAGFAWLVPISPHKAYAGLLAASRAKLHLQEFLDGLVSRGRIAGGQVRIAQKAVPLGTLPRSYGDRVLVIGDAAGQVKPTTGGGIYFGHLGARIAARVLDEALDNDNLTAAYLSRYEKEWKAKMGGELSRGHWARWAYARLSDRQIEGIFSALDSSDMVEAWRSSGCFSFDWHGRLLSAVLKRTSAYPWLKIKHLLSRAANS